VICCDESVDVLLTELRDVRENERHRTGCECDAAPAAADADDANSAEPCDC